MNEQLHPLTLGEILDRTAQLYRSRFLVYFGIGVIPAGTVLVFAAAVFVFFAWVGSDAAGGVPATLTRIVPWLFLGSALLLAIPVCLGATALGWAAMCHSASRTFLGQEVTIREAYRAALRRGWRYVWLYSLVALIVGAAPIAVAIAAIPVTAGLAVLARESGLGNAAGAFAAGVILLLAAGLAGYAVWMLLRLCLAFPTCVVEEMSAWNALKRGTALSQGTKGRIILLFLLGYALTWLLALGFTIPVGILLALVPGANNPQHAQMLGTILMFSWYGLWFAVQALTKPVYGIALTLFYFDQRIRKEGFDIEWMMQQAGMSFDRQMPGGQPGPASTSELRVDTPSGSDPAKSAFPESPEPPFPGVPQT
jgi:hypothetical protein